MPKLSIIVPVYNVEKYIHNCVDSILAQDFSDFELILVNDGSTDNSGRICDEYAKKDRIIVIHKTNGGQSSARNAALDIATGNYITFIDSDDTISSNTFSRNIALLDNDPQIDIIQFPNTYIHISSPDKISQPTPQYINGILNKYANWLVNKVLTNYVCAKIFRKELFSKLRFRERIYFEDRYINCDLLDSSSTIYVSDTGMYNYYYRPGSTTQKPQDKKILQSQIVADLNIVRHLIKHKILSNIAVERYCYCLHHYQLMQKNRWELDKDTLQEFKEVRIPFLDIITSKAAYGYRLRCLISHIFGLNFSTNF